MFQTHIKFKLSRILNQGESDLYLIQLHRIFRYVMTVQFKAPDKYKQNIKSLNFNLHKIDG